MKYYEKLEEYRVLVFSTCKDYEEEFIGSEKNEYDGFIERTKKMIRIETKGSLTSISQSKDKLDKHRQAQRLYDDMFEAQCDDFSNALEKFKSSVIS